MFCGDDWVPVAELVALDWPVESFPQPAKTSSAVPMTAARENFRVFIVCAFHFCAIEKERDSQKGFLAECVPD
jgi:hypothetical protein